VRNNSTPATFWRGLFFAPLKEFPYRLARERRDRREGLLGHPGERLHLRVGQPDDGSFHGPIVPCLADSSFVPPQNPQKVLWAVHLDQLGVIRSTIPPFFNGPKYCRVPVNVLTPLPGPLRKHTLAVCIGMELNDVITAR
jgi:hypothetical protein